MTHEHADGHWQIVTVTVEDDDRENPAWDDVRAAIQSLDASQRRSSVVIEAADESLMLIGGGMRRLHVQITYPPGTQPEILVLVDPSRGAEPEGLIVDGIETPLPARLIVDEATALRAALGFFENGVVDPALTWEER